MATGKMITLVVSLVTIATTAFCQNTPKVVVFPADSIVKATACSSTLYSIPDVLLKEKLGELPAPDKNPTFSGDVDKLKKYFAAHPLNDERVVNMIFRVKIAFLVTCDGNAGNYVIVSKGKGDLATYANMVLAVVNKMPQNWRPALHAEKPVDCYQELSFTVLNGQLDGVSYK
ncbi:MAG TPA: hypothetical protein VFF27_02240 [Bacteroidia bacterium]|jgi:hypothetical protein|nr:hypothetical protein [Bacteroidia bacterium]